MPQPVSAFNPRAPEVLTQARRARALLASFARLAPEDGEARFALLRELFGRVGAGVWVEPPFYCEYGPQIHIGDDTFVNVNAVFLDAAPIHIGARGLLAPGVQLLTVTHPVRAADRTVTMRQPGDAPYVTQSAPITIGDDVWLGAGVIVLPGVQIGDRVTVGAGAVVTADLPSDTLALGVPARAVRSLTT
jgi:maltose O-acetyltransferase